MPGSSILSLESHSLSNFHNPSLADSVLDAIDGAHPDLRPTKYGHAQPPKQRYRPGSRVDVARVWINEASERDGYVPFSGSLAMGNDLPSKTEYMMSWRREERRFNVFALYVNLDYARSQQGLDNFMSLGRELVMRTGVVFGIVRNHGFTDWDYLFDLKVRLPDPNCFMLFFGQPYVQWFGAERLLGAPCHHAEALPSGHIVLSMVSNPFEPIVPQARRALVDYLGSEAFMEPGRSLRSYKSGLAPEFDFSEIINAGG